MLERRVVGMQEGPGEAETGLSGMRTTPGGWALPGLPDGPGHCSLATAGGEGPPGHASSRGFLPNTAGPALQISLGRGRLATGLGSIPPSK